MGSQRSCNAHLKPRPKLIFTFLKINILKVIQGSPFLPFDSREDILKDLTIYGHGGHLGHVTNMYIIWTNSDPHPHPAPIIKAPHEIWLMRQAA